MSRHPDITFAPLAFADLPGWAEDDHAKAFAAFLGSCGAVARRAGRASEAGARAKPPPPALVAACAAAAALAAGPRRPTRSGARAFFERHFLPHRVVHAGPEGLLTGYYEPLLEGAREPSERFQVPILRRPPDLENLVEESLRGASGAGLTHARRTPAGLVPYPTRAEIEAGALAGHGLELVWLADPVDAYFLHVQGSGRIRFADGTSLRLGYDGKNGHPYTSIGRHLIDTGVIGAERMSLQALAAWLKADPARGRTVMQRNASYVFFRELTGPEAAGALGVDGITLTAGRSLAVDAGVHHIGTPIHVVAPTLIHAGGRGGLQRLMIAHDVGSAIRGPERGDVYFGSGAAAGRRAGITRHSGRFFVLLAREAEPPRAAGER
jgi:membrane-bound lytic murein transglycosylase A